MPKVSPHVTALAVVLTAVVVLSFSPGAAVAVHSPMLPRAAPVTPPASSLAGTPLTPAVDPFGLAVGDQAEVAASSLNVRQAPSTSSGVLSVEPQYRQGLIVAGSDTADGYIWWEVSWDDNVTGWSAEGSNSTDWIENITGSTITFNRDAAMTYAAEYWNVVTSDGYFWDGPDSYEQFAQGTSVVGLSGDDCAHFVSQVIGDQPNQPGGGLNIPSRVPPTYGEPSAPDLGNMILDNGWGVQVSGVNQLEPGDVINYEWEETDGTWDHIAVYLGNGEVAAHTDSNYDANWTLGGAYAYRFIHILATTQGGSGIDHPDVTLTLASPSGTAPLAEVATLAVVGGSTVYSTEEISWGDGTSSAVTGGSASHTYATAGTYIVEAKVIDSLGAVGWSSNETVTVTASSPPPLAVALSVDPSTGTTPLPVQFSATATGGSGSYASYTWQFGDGNSETTPAPSVSHTYSAAGSFSATVEVTDAQTGSTATSSAATVSVSAGTSPLAVTISADPASGEAPLSVTFSAVASGGTGAYDAYAWTFGDGTSTSTTANSVLHQYTSAGTFPVTVTVSDGSSTATSASVQVLVSAPPALTVTLQSSGSAGTVPFELTLSAHVDGGVAPYSAAWTFGDGVSVPLETVSGSVATTTHQYVTAGNYQVTVTVQDAAGTQASASISVLAQAPSAPPTSTSSSSQGALLSSSWEVDLALGVGALAVVLAVGLTWARRRRTPPPA